MYKDDALPFRKIWKRDWLKLKEEYIEWQSFHQATREDVYIGTCEDYPIELSFEALKYIFGQFGEVIYINLLEKKLYVRFKLQSELDRAASNRIIEFPDTGTIVTVNPLNRKFDLFLEFEAWKYCRSKVEGAHGRGTRTETSEH